MKKIIILAAMIAATVSMNSANTITLGDSVRISPKYLDGYFHHAVTMHNDGYCDTWSVAMTYPEGLTVKLVAGVMPLDGMTIPYVDRFGEQQVLECPLTVSAAYANISSTITTMGYWDYDGDGWFDPYGTVKWSEGAHAMWEFNFYVDPSFRCGYVAFDGTMSSGYDQRGPILQGVRVYSKTWMWVGYQRGDVDGNDKIGMGDLTELINYLVYGDGLDEFQTAAADVNASGHINMDDMTTLINWLVNA